MPDAARHITLDVSPVDITLSSMASRTIAGLAVPAGEIGNTSVGPVRFLPNSIEFGANTPLLSYHDTTRPIGRLTSHSWQNTGLHVQFAVSRTQAGDDALQLANDGVLGISVGITASNDDTRMVDGVLEVSRAIGGELSLTPIPAFQSARVTHVALSRGSAMPDDPTTAGAVPAPVAVAPPAPAPQLQLSAEQMAAITAVLQQPTPAPAPLAPTAPVTAPVTVPLPTGASVVREQPVYRFDGRRAQYNLTDDISAAFRQGDSVARQRIQEYLFAVDTGDVATLNPSVYRPDYFVDTPAYNRPLAGLITQGTLDSITSFYWPRFKSAGNLVNPHVEGVEPTLGSFETDEDMVQPHALSGKIEINREVMDQAGSPQTDQLIWNKMLEANNQAAEVRVMVLLDSVAPTGTNYIHISGTDADAVGSLTDGLLALQYAQPPRNYNSLAFAQDAYSAMVSAVDGDGRKLLPVLAPQNADGTVANGYGSISVGGLNGRPAWALTGDSFLWVKSSVFQWVSKPRKLTFDYQVHSVFLALWAYSAECIFDENDVLRVTYSA